MSNRVKKIVKEVQENKNQNVYHMCNCTAGSAICTIGKLAGKCTISPCTFLFLQESLCLSRS